MIMSQHDIFLDVGMCMFGLLALTSTFTFTFTKGVKGTNADADAAAMSNEIREYMQKVGMFIMCAACCVTCFMN